MPPMKCSECSAEISTKHAAHAARGVGEQVQAGVTPDVNKTPGDDFIVKGGAGVLGALLGAAVGAMAFFMVPCLLFLGGNLCGLFGIFIAPIGALVGSISGVLFALRMINNSKK